MKPVFLYCKECDTMVEVIYGTHIHRICDCGKPLEEMVPNTTEGAAEKHLPVVEHNGNEIKVNVGSVLHPMSEEHSISWVYLETELGCQRYHFTPDAEPIAVFSVVPGDKPVAVYAYCNLHGLWMTEVN
ncbi:desulfoferrodoxin family protein [Anaerolentibacter hominis]|uniref:desulfoferrodoxin family protein n=1 Tax=Anaerolentibacter hominis TaxID=3079009 RepID=UPI0031B89E0D